MRKTFLYHAKINNQTETTCHKWLNICREVYNSALSQRINKFKETGKTISCYDQQKQLTSIKRDFPETKKVNSQTLQDVLERLDKGYKAFFRRVKSGEKPGFPRFKNRQGYNSFTLKQTGYKLDGRYLHIKNVGRFKLFLSRPIEGDIKTITVRRTSTNKWFASFSCDNVPTQILTEIDKEVGIDVGIKSFCVDSEGEQTQNPKFFKQSEKLLRRRQRSLCRKKKGSIRRSKTRLLVAKAHEKVTNQRKDFLHKVANQYIGKFQTIYIEDLNIKGMIKNRHLSKSIADCSWKTFFQFLSYKAENAGRKVIKVNPNGTSQKCSACGERVPKNLSVRIHNCPFCGLKIDRDLNASINIRRDGQSRQALTSDMLELVA
ncbi:MAG: transposase [Candidatus Kuenenia sp.]|nr:transposase [Candidatus Kuenenia sp.]